MYVCVYKIKIEYVIIHLNYFLKTLQRYETINSFIFLFQVSSKQSTISNRIQMKREL